MGGKPQKNTPKDMRLRENKQAAQAKATANKSIIARRGKPL
jgi:hypothetical protein